MNISPLTLQEMAGKGFTHQIEIDHTDLVDTAGTTKTIPLIDMPAGSVVLAAALKLDPAFDFSDAGITSLTVQLGIGGATAAILPITELAVDGTEITAYVSKNALDTMPYHFVAADTIDALFTVANGGTPLLSEVTSGKVIFLLQISKL